MAKENSLNFVNIIKKICLMKCYTLYNYKIAVVLVALTTKGQNTERPSYRIIVTSSHKSTCQVCISCLRLYLVNKKSEQHTSVFMRHRLQHLNRNMSNLWKSDTIYRRRDNTFLLNSHSIASVILIFLNSGKSFILLRCFMILWSIIYSDHLIILKLFQYIISGCIMLTGEA